MKITLAPHGGLAAGIRRPAKVLDTGALSTEAASEIERLVKAAASKSRPPKAAPSLRDAIGYTITLERDGETTVLKASDGAMNPAFAALLEWLEKNVTRKP